MEELHALLGRVENAKILAGGQSLVPMLNMRFVLPDHIIDINRIPELASIREAGDAIEIAAMVRQRASSSSGRSRARHRCRLPADRRFGRSMTSRAPSSGRRKHQHEARENCRFISEPLPDCPIRQGQRSAGREIETD